MKVYFDYQIFYFQKYGGISKYFIEMARELRELDSCEPLILAPFHANAYLAEKRNESLNYSIGALKRKLLHNRFSDKRVEFNHEIAKKLCETENCILHETYYADRIPVKAKKVVTIHDMIYELFDSGLGDREVTIKNKKQAMDEAEAIIAVSENTKKDILKFYPSLLKKIHVVHHGVKQENKAEAYQHPRSFILHVGTRGWYKNFDLLLKIFGEQKKINENFDLISFGGGAASEMEKKIIEQYNLGAKVHFLSGSEALLDSLYKGARALVYISAYEGFGMSLLEAMAASCPVLASNSSSIPEVAGNAALLVDPKKEAELALALKEITGNEAIRKSLVEAGRERAKLFTWKKCAQETFKVYEGVLK